MTIQGKLRAVATLAAGSLLFMALFIGRSLNSLSALEESRMLVQRVETGVLTLRRDEKDFLARLDRKYANAFDGHVTKLKTRIGELIGALDDNGIDAGDARRLQPVIDRYEAAFRDVVAHAEAMGLTADSGLQGELRGAIHEVEQAFAELGDDGLMAAMLMLRRNEKDFMLRHDGKYLDTFGRNLAKAQAALSARPYPDATKGAIGALLARYQERFTAYVERARALGLRPDQGALGVMRDTVHETETFIAKVLETTGQAVAAEAAIMKRNAMLLAAGLGLGVVAIILLIGRGIVSRLQLAARAMEQIRDRNDLTLRLDAAGGDELSLLGSDFNSMMTSFADLVREVGGSVSRLSAAAEELSAITEQTNAGMRRQQGETEGVAAAMHEMAATVDEIARTTEQAAESARQADGEARQGQVVVAGAVTAIERLAEDVRRAGDAMRKLEEETKGIGAILDVIRSVAEQTNLLALNAAIEAARAGEQGRGFAVVADEVRNLAQRTSQSVGEIETMIRRLQAEAGGAMQVMAEGSRKSEASVREASAVSVSLGVLVEGVAAISELNIHIASASSQQRAVTEDVSRSVAAIKHVTDETADGVAHVAASSHELADVAHRLDGLVRRFTV